MLRVSMFDSFLFLIIHFKDIVHFVYAFISRWTFGSFLGWGYYELSGCKHSFMDIWVAMCFLSSGEQLESGMAGSYSRCMLPFLRNC